MRQIERVVAHGLVKTYGGTAALRGVDAVFDKALLTLVEGANGSGKSTLLGILGQVVRPTSGRVDYEPLGDDARAIRSALGWVSHESLAYGDLSGQKNVELAARLHGLDASVAWEQVADRFQLGAFSRRPLRTCSRGQKQRIALARALVHAPSFLLLDEPTAGLDKAGVERLVAVVGEEITRGAAVVLVSHEPEIFRPLAGARVVLERGRIASSSG